MNKTPVTDVYEVRGKEIYLVRTIYYGFGAGVPTEIEAGQSLTYGDDGEMIISGMDMAVPHLVYVVGTVSDHVLNISGEDISLREMCGRNSKVLFSVR
ncbi:MAG: DUF1850 domain-containing protein [Oscillospiraceae bacterium]|nr:DUF1850 domain-containing protein [Oscillospiraceae bacterium]